MSSKRFNILLGVVATFCEEPDVGVITDTGNTVFRSWQDSDGYHASVTLHGNEIAYLDRTHDGIVNVAVRTAGWPTMATKNVLNAVLKGAGIKSCIVKNGSNLFIDYLPQPHVAGQGEYLPEQEWLHVE